MLLKKTIFTIASILSVSLAFSSDNVLSTVDVCGPIPNGWNLIYENKTDGTTRGSLQQLKELVKQGANIKISAAHGTTDGGISLHHHVCDRTVIYNEDIIKCARFSRVSAGAKQSGDIFHVRPHYLYIDAFSNGKNLAHRFYEDGRPFPNQSTREDSAAIQWFAKCS